MSTAKAELPAAPAATRQAIILIVDAEGNMIFSRCKVFGILSHVLSISIRRGFSAGVAHNVITRHAVK